MSEESQESSQAEQNAGAETEANTGADTSDKQTEAWYSGLPAEAHDKLKGFGTLDEALGALERSGKHTYAKTTDDFKLNGVLDGVQLTDTEKATIDDFKSFCLESEITPKQAEALLKYQQDLVTKQTNQSIETGTAALKALWGKDYDKNKDRSMLAVQAIDKKMEGRLAAALTNNPIANEPAFIELMHTIGTMIGEDSLGIGSPGGSDDKPISREDAYKQMFKG